jgi:hypothetical protein
MSESSGRGLSMIRRLLEFWRGILKRRRCACTEKATVRNRVYFESLESRVLLSGGVEGALVDTELLAYEGFSQAPVAAEIAFLEEAHGTALLDLSGSADPHPKMQSDLLEGLAMRELVFFDGNLAGCQQLIADLQRADGNRNIEVVALESDRNGIEQVSEILSERSGRNGGHPLLRL